MERGSIGSVVVDAFLATVFHLSSELRCASTWAEKTCPIREDTEIGSVAFCFEDGLSKERDIFGAPRVKGHRPRIRESRIERATRRGRRASRDRANPIRHLPLSDPSFYLTLTTVSAPQSCAPASTRTQTPSPAPIKVVLIYGPFDVQPAAKSGGTPSRSWSRKRRTGASWGAGAPCWVGERAAMAQEARDGAAGEPHDGGERERGLDALVVGEKDVDCVCILNMGTPALKAGLRGLVYFKLTARDLHSGVFGRTVHKPMTDLIALMGRLVFPAGDILVPCVHDMVTRSSGACSSIWVFSLTYVLEDSAIYDKLDYSIADASFSPPPCPVPRHELVLTHAQVQVLLGRMCLPSLSLHGIEGAFAEAAREDGHLRKVCVSLRVATHLPPPRAIHSAALLPHPPRLARPRRRPPISASCWYPLSPSIGVPTRPPQTPARGVPPRARAGGKSEPRARSAWSRARAWRTRCSFCRARVRRCGVLARYGAARVEDGPSVRADARASTRFGAPGALSRGGADTSPRAMASHAATDAVLVREMWARAARGASTNEKLHKSNLIEGTKLLGTREVGVAREDLGERNGTGTRKDEQENQERNPNVRFLCCVSLF
ncbi:hypothetical protein FB451DRAFT_1370832 [Mycena latifolia]|nr:hypothetical protein FB451DRAFT_1370832 [Mycena latifolia]